MSRVYMTINYDALENRCAKNPQAKKFRKKTPACKKPSVCKTVTGEQIAAMQKEYGISDAEAINELFAM